MRVLVVEDEMFVAELIQHALEARGMTCLRAETAEEAERVLSGQEIDAVTLDLGMPGRGGLDWLEEMSGQRPDLARKTLVITGLSLDTALVERLASCGAGVLAKPFTIDGLQDAFRSQVDHLDPDSRPS